MKKEIADIWIAGLLSGEYMQGHNVLTTESGLDCCLGVLCKLAIKAGVISEPIIFGGNHQYGEDGDRSSTCLPVKVMQWAGIKTPKGTLPSSFSCPSLPNTGALSGLNDNGMPFEEIAKVIAENVEDL